LIENRNSRWGSFPGEIDGICGTGSGWFSTGKQELALLGTMLLLFGLILKVQVHAPITENPAIHTLRSVLVEELLTFEALHPPAKPVSPVLPNSLTTSETDLDGHSA
jgi:hypothetical protein